MCSVGAVLLMVDGMVVMGIGKEGRQEGLGGGSIPVLIF